MISTCDTLLGRLKAENAHEAWKEFYELYWGAILRYARKLGLDETQAQDVLQETMVALMRILPEFAYDRGKGKFRSFLLTIVHRKSLGVLRRARRSTEVPLSETVERDTVSSFATSESVDEETLARWRLSLLEEALRRLKANGALAENTFAVFHAYAVERRPVQEVAREFGLKENAVYQIKNRLLARIQHEVAKMMRSGGADADV